MSNLSEEEKEAIKELKTNAEYCINEDKYLKYDKYETKKIIMPVLNYIDRLQKENISLKQENDFLKMMYRGTDEFKRIERFANGK